MATKKIRVYELARELGVENPIIMDLAAELKLGVKSHSSSIDEPSADRVRRLADAKGLKREPEPEPAPVPEPAPAPEPVLAPVPATAATAAAPAPAAADAPATAPVAPRPTAPLATPATAPADAPISTPDQQVAASVDTAIDTPPAAAEPRQRIERSKSAVRSTGGIPTPPPMMER
ncbi:MAG TPA: translation initiation factor IF-2 N-terminal domain-containing protein, partial [Acidimicrobiia bacterium]